MYILFLSIIRKLKILESRLELRILCLQYSISVLDGRVVQNNSISYKEVNRIRIRNSLLMISYFSSLSVSTPDFLSLPIT